MFEFVFQPNTEKGSWTDLWYITIRYTISKESQWFNHLNTLRFKIICFKIIFIGKNHTIGSNVHTCVQISTPVKKYQNIIYIHRLICSQTNIVSLRWIFDGVVDFHWVFDFNWVVDSDCVDQASKPTFFSLKSFTKFFLVFFFEYFLVLSTLYTNNTKNIDKKELYIYSLLETQELQQNNVMNFMEDCHEKHFMKKKWKKWLTKKALWKNALWKNYF